MSHPRTFFLSLLLIGSTALLAGCGGGGGGGNSGGGGHASLGAATGKIVDQTGTPVPTAVVLVDGAQQNPTPASGGTSYLVGGASFGQGGYRLEGLPAGFHIITAQASNGETGSTQVFAIGNFTTSSANIVVSPPAQQSTISGTVVAGDTGRPIPGAHVFLRYPVSYPVTPTPGVPDGYASLSGFTDANGRYEMYNVPVYTNTSATTRQVYTLAASFQPPTGNAVYDNAILSGQTFPVGSAPALPNLVLPRHSGGYSTGSPNPFAPTITLAEAFTQPNIPSVGPAAAGQARPAAARKAAYEQIRRLLSPAYARLSDARHAAAQVRRVSAQPRATANDYAIEMDLFFSLPEDTQTPDSPRRSQLFGFAIYNNINTAGDFLEDPLANFYADPSLSATQFYAADTTYRFEVDSIASDTTSTLGSSSVQSVTPLEFVNLRHPLDPNDTGRVETLPGNAIQWNGISRARNYAVLIYATFPGVNTTPLPQSADGQAGDQPLLSGSTTSYSLPAGLTAGHEYWVVVAAVATDDTAQSQAISFSQITPFQVP